MSRVPPFDDPFFSCRTAAAPSAAGWSKARYSSGIPFDCWRESSPYRPWITVPDGEIAAESLADNLGGLVERSIV